MLSFATGNALAADGIVEINQACAPIGCFPGDAPGWPITIAAEGSYVLTSNLQVPAGAEGIVVSGSRVVLDLGGHVISGGNTCTGQPPSCSNQGALRGIFNGIMNFPANVTIRNGTVAGFIAECIRMSGSGVILEDLQVSSCSGNAITHFGQGIIDRVLVRNAAGNGIETNNQVLVRDSYLLNNGGYGVDFGLCSGNVFVGNGDAAGVPEENCGATLATNICDGSPCP